MVVEPPSVASRKRPRGLWKGQMLSPAAVTLSASTSEDSLSENDDADTSTSSSGNSKRRKRDLISVNNELDNQPILLRHRDLELSICTVTRNEKKSAGPPLTEQATEGVPGHGDWENLKGMFAQAVERYESERARCWILSDS